MAFAGRFSGVPFGTQGVMQCSLREFADYGAAQDFKKVSPRFNELIYLSFILPG